MARVAVLGCGPAGLFAAYALELKGVTAMLFSRATKSKIAGAQYLHIPIFGLTGEEPDFTVKYEKWGSAQGYANKVYQNGRHPSSWNLWDEGEKPAWNLRRVYDTLWGMYSEKVNHVENIGTPTIDRLLPRFDLIINTLPKMHICKNPNHEFETVVVEIERVESELVPENTIIYNGIPLTEWHRASNIAGMATREYRRGYGKGPAFTKPQANNCDCWRGDVMPAGRNGKWKRDVLSHDAFTETLQWFTV